MGRKIVVFADGTGNAFGTQESNVWRLFQALDQSDPDQLARYIPGVGTSGFKPFALLDGATGLGVPSNVRKLYRFICWNWRPGDEIWMFGFSRGAFTIRTLASLITSQGLVPARIGTSPVSRVEMDRNAMAAWRDYRTRTAPAGWTRPTIALTRAIRDAWLWLYHGLAGHRSYAAVRKEMQRQADIPETAEADPRENRIKVSTEFLGLFDTVEAFGVPLEEMRRAIDRAIWPISFRNRVLAKRVKHVRHALALDDERTSFHPVLFDMRDEEKRSRIREVWFAGVHSDVGGGYPDPSLALVPLNWMLEEIDALPNGGLRFDAGAVATFRINASPFGPRHDSRSGLAVAYRYGPRHIRIDGSGDGPVIHHSVLEKMALGNDLYAPVMLPANARVRVPLIVGSVAPEPLLPLGDPEVATRIPSLGPRSRLPAPVQTFIDSAHDTVWWRRVVYFLMLAAVAVVGLLPWIASHLPELFDGSMRALLRPLGLLHQWDAYWQRRMIDGDAISSNLDLLSPTIGSMIPSFARIYLEAVVEQPGACGAVLLLTWLLYRHSCSLRDRIADLARCGWFARSGTPYAPARQPPYFQRRTSRKPSRDAPATFASRLARTLRTSPAARGLYGFTTHKLAPLLFIATFAVFGLNVVSRSTVTSRSATGAMCREKPLGELKTLAEGQSMLIDKLFATDQVCWPSDIRLERGERYRIQLVERDPWFDKSVISGVAGFTTKTRQHALALPLRRNPDADWMQPIARVGRHEGAESDFRYDGGAEFPLLAWNGPDARGDVQNSLGRAVSTESIKDDTSSEASSGGGCLLDFPWISAKLPNSALKKAEELHRSLHRIPRTYTSEFVSKADGELFIFVNDAIFGLPYLNICNWFYQNNRGTAAVWIEHVATPKIAE